MWLHLIGCELIFNLYINTYFYVCICKLKINITSVRKNFLKIFHS